MRNSVWWVPLTCVIAAGCGGDDDSGPPPNTADCTPRAECICPSGRTGTLNCDDAGNLLGCRCLDDAGADAPRSEGGATMDVSAERFERDASDADVSSDGFRADASAPADALHENVGPIPDGGRDAGNAPDAGSSDVATEGGSGSSDAASDGDSQDDAQDGGSKDVGLEYCVRDVSVLDF
jgi:hypothetical protein